MTYPVDRTAAQVNTPIRIKSDAHAPMTGLVHNTSGLSIDYKLPTQSTWTNIPLVAGTLGTWTSGGFAEEPGTPNGDGWYQLGMPAAAIQAGLVTRIRVKTSGNAYRYGFVAAVVDPSAGNGQVPITIEVEDSVASAIPGAQITIRDDASKVVAFGTATAGTKLFGLAPGDYTVLTTATGYDADSTEITVSSTETFTITLDEAETEEVDTTPDTTLRRYTAVDWNIPFVLGSLTGVTWSELRFTAKTSPTEQDDDEAVIQVKLTDGGDVSDGLIVLNGVTVGLTKAHASITISEEATGTGYVTIKAAATEQVAATSQDYWNATDAALQSQTNWRTTSALDPPLLHWDVKRLDGSGSASPDRASGILVVLESVTQDVV